MLRQTKCISHIRTTGEIGALLLEARMIKQQQPLLNKKLRRNRQLWTLALRNGLPTMVDSLTVNFATAPNLHGLFSSRHAALETLYKLADDNQLCLGALGLEKLKPGKPCFRASIRLCKGVCRGTEDPAHHQARWLSSLLRLRLACWPYEAGVGLIERFDNEVQVHAVRNWCYLGSAADIQGARRLDRPAAGFDADGYKILCKPILNGAVQIVAL